MAEICRRLHSKILFNIQDFEECGGILVEVPSKESNRTVVDFVCNKCGSHTEHIVVRNPQASSMEDDDEEDEIHMLRLIP